MPATPRPPTPGSPRRAATVTRRRLTGQVVGNTTLACFFGCLVLLFGWAATVLAQRYGSSALLAALSLACHATLATAALVLAAMIAARARHRRPTTSLLTAASRLAWLHLSVALAVLLLIAITSPYVVPLALIPVVLAGTAGLFLLNTRDAVRRYADNVPRDADEVVTGARLE
ncbi:hypothetical protein [Actinoplanes sp. GCM10030250]|uniref:hypothetical protein n=1 Tax=Actinoplanes sp. GCM10030250 TaxID=3273376 RepID=UPI003613BACC